MSTLTESQTKKVSAAMRILGRVRSEKKTAAVRENAKKGGYPKGRKRGPRIKAAVQLLIAFWLIGSAGLIYVGETNPPHGSARLLPGGIEITP